MRRLRERHPVLVGLVAVVVAVLAVVAILAALTPPKAHAHAVGQQDQPSRAHDVAGRAPGASLRPSVRPLHLSS